MLVVSDDFKCLILKEFFKLYAYQAFILLKQFNKVKITTIVNESWR